MANPSSQFSDKSRLRDQMRERLKHLSPGERRTRSLGICAELRPHFAGKKSIALFAPTPIEPDLDLLWDLDLLNDCLVGYPRCAGETLTYHPIAKPEDLALGRFGIREPAVGPQLEKLDLIVVPGLAFTVPGNRLGRGGGYYDRFLATVPTTTLKVGVCFEFQLVPQIPPESHDVIMDVVVHA
jgi:5-formyltetrahydrofolate cyclo-ligase